MEIVILEEANKEILVAHDWYESRRKGLGFDFELCLEATLDKISRFPESYQIHYRVTRRALVPHFPYGVYFTISKETVYVIAIVHVKRNPKILKKAISNLHKKHH